MPQLVMIESRDDVHSFRLAGGPVLRVYPSTVVPGHWVVEMDGTEIGDQARAVGSVDSLLLMLGGAYEALEAVRTKLDNDAPASVAR